MFFHLSLLRLRVAYMGSNLWLLRFAPNGLPLELNGGGLFCAIRGLSDFLPMRNVYLMYDLFSIAAILRIAGLVVPLE